MNSAERRAQRLPKTPTDAQGQTIWLTGPELELCHRASTLLSNVRTALEQSAGGPQDTEAQALMQHDLNLLTQALGGVRAGGNLAQAYFIAPPELLRSMTVVLRAYRRTESACAAVLAAAPEAQNVVFADLMGQLADALGITRLDPVAMAALEHKLYRIDAALRGEAGVEA